MLAICKLWVQLFVNAGNGWPHRRCGIISSYQSAVTSEIVKALLATSSSCVKAL